MQESNSDSNSIIGRAKISTLATVVTAPRPGLDLAMDQNYNGNGMVFGGVFWHHLLLIVMLALHARSLMLIFTSN